MDHRAVILDGITVQHVAEVLYNTAATRDIWGECFASYLSSLEDFAFGVLFGETVTLSGSMPPVGDSTPGAQLLRESALQGVLVAIQMEQPAGIATLLNNDVKLRGAVERDLEAVGRLSEDEVEPFRHFYIREVRGYLGTDPSIFEKGSSPKRVGDFE